MRFGTILILFLLSSCAQVGVLNGGIDDESAPQPILEKMSPRNGATSFSGKELVIPFDEYIKLQNPNETIIVVPPNIKPTAKVKKKSLVLTWKEELSPNTTYAFYLNETVQDTKESNDSLMCFVFSTGTYIDSLSVTYFVRDAFTNEPLKDYIVGLYEQFSDTIRPTYFAQTDAQGKATLSYLKPGTFEIAAFLDKSKDLKHQLDEPFGYKKEPILLIENQVDSVPLRSYLPQQMPKVTNLSFHPPGSFFLTANRSLEKASFVLNDLPISTENCVFFSSDSLLLPFETSDTSKYTLITRAENWTDTTSIRITQKEKSQASTLKFEKGNELLPKLPITFISSAEIKSLDTALIVVQNVQDSSNLIVTQLIFKGNKIDLNFERENVLAANFLFLPGAIETKNGKNTDTLLLKASCLGSKDVGSLAVDISEFTESIVLEILLGKTLIQSVPLAKTVRKHTFTNLKAGEYSFRFIYDENENGLWDVGNRDLKTQAERVESFPEMQKVRANWDLEVVLKKAENGNTE